MKSKNIESSTSRKNDYIFDIMEGNKLKISSNFQCGNIRVLRQNNPLSYTLESVSDVVGTQAKKSWYYFKMQCVSGYRVRLSIQNVNILQYCQDRPDYQPLFRIGNQGRWQPTTNAFLSSNDELALLFDYRFTSQEEVYFCISVPFSYTDQLQYLKEYQQKILPQISFKNQRLALTPQKRQVRLLTLTEYGKDTYELQKKYKPVVLITCRVHPGEVSSSYCLMGLLQMLIQNTLQSYLLRRMFQWRIVPMVNPDGVVAGNYRLDTQGSNLNRYYSDPRQSQHPAIFAIMKMMNHLSQSPKKIQFYLDMHSHSSMRQTFIYGNALEDVIKQSYTQLFCKILQENSIWFRYSFCQFGERHMKHKDKGEEKSKEGCGRVMAYKVGKVVRSYTIESSMLPGFYVRNQRNILKKQKNYQFSYQPSNYQQMLSLNEDPEVNNEIPIIAVNKEFGRALLISVLDMLEKNPYCRSVSHSNEVFMKDCAPKLLLSEQRFKVHDCQSYSKAKMAYKLASDQIQDRLEEAWNKMELSAELNSSEWPLQFRLFKIIETNTKGKSNKTGRLNTEFFQFKSHKRFKTRPRLQTDTSIRSDNLVTKLQGRQKDRLVFLQKVNKERQSLQLNCSSETEDKVINFRQIDIFEDIQPQSIDRRISPSIKFKNEVKNNTPRRYMVQNLSPSISMLQTSKYVAMEKQKYKKIKGGSYFYRAIVDNRKKTASYLKSIKNLHSISNSRAKSNLEVQVPQSQKPKASPHINRVDLNMAYREGLDSIKLTQKMDIMFPWMKKNQIKLKKELYLSGQFC